MFNKFLPKKKILHFRPVFYGFVFLFFGVWFAMPVFNGDFDSILTALLIATITVLSCCHYGKLKELLFLCLVFMVGFGLFFVGLCGFEGSVFEGKVTVSGRVQDGIYENEQLYRVVLDNVVVNGNSERNVQVYIYKTQSERAFEEGSVVSFSATLKNVNLLGEDGGIFTLYLQNDTPYVASVSESMLTVAEGWLTPTEMLRAAVKELLYGNMSEQGAAVAYASLFGDKGFVNDEIYNIFKDSGILHLLAVSGGHIIFLMLILNFAFRKMRLKRVYSFLITATVLLFYAALCSFSPPVMRAVIMSLIISGAKLSKRQYDSLNSLGLSGLLFVFASPLMLLDGGFLLSFFSVFAIFALHKPLTELFSKFLFQPVAECAALTVAAQIGVIPFLADMHGTVNILTVFANLLLVPLFGIIITLLFLFVCIGLILPFMGFLFWVVDSLIWLLVFIASFFAAAKVFIIALQPLKTIYKLCVLAAIFLCSRFVMIKNTRKLFYFSGIFAFCCVLVLCC